MNAVIPGRAFSLVTMARRLGIMLACEGCSRPEEWSMSRWAQCLCLRPH
jgi:EAL domain-containing protein (putative c-di-GMP-specific phosphodiesterase class I)